MFGQYGAAKRRCESESGCGRRLDTVKDGDPRAGPYPGCYGKWGVLVRDAGPKF
jgi:hypothetical protein